MMGGEALAADGGIPPQSLRQRRPTTQRRRYSTNTDTDAIYLRVE